MISGLPQLLHRCGVVLTAVALFSVAGGHWALLQTVAWARMVQDYSQGSTVAAAVEKTFSGKAPCAMCRKIAAAKKEEQQTPATVKVEKKAETFVASAGSMVKEPEGQKFSYSFPSDAGYAARAEAPVAPVPIVRA